MRPAKKLEQKFLVEAYRPRGKRTPKITIVVHAFERETAEAGYRVLVDGWKADAGVSLALVRVELDHLGREHVRELLAEHPPTTMAPGVIAGGESPAPKQLELVSPASTARRRRHSFRRGS